jgi:hypothetical protein
MYGDIQVVAEAASGAEGIEAVLTHRPTWPWWTCT